MLGNALPLSYTFYRGRSWKDSNLQPFVFNENPTSPAREKHYIMVGINVSIEFIWGQLCRNLYILFEVLSTEFRVLS